MVRLLDKKLEADMLSCLFDLMYDNMEVVAPGGLACAWEKSRWLAEVISV